MSRKYRQLEKGEIIQEGDEVDNCANSWHDEARWEPTACVGKRAPDPKYPAHRIYRRRIDAGGNESDKDYSEMSSDDLADALDYALLAVKTVQAHAEQNARSPVGPKMGDEVYLLGREGGPMSLADCEAILRRYRTAKR